MNLITLKLSKDEAFKYLYQKQDTEKPIRDLTASN